jgi:hypothetical protein
MTNELEGIRRRISYGTCYGTSGVSDVEYLLVQLDEQTKKATQWEQSYDRLLREFAESTASYKAKLAERDALHFAETGEPAR